MTETAYGTYIKDYFYIKVAQQFFVFFLLLIALHITKNSNYWAPLSTGDSLCKRWT